MYYKDVLPISRQDAEEAFSLGNYEEISDALVRLSYHDPDWKWVQEKCLYFCMHPQSEIRGVAVTCIGHLARIHGILDMEYVRTILNELLKDPEVSGRAKDALEDIEIYLLHK